VTPLLYRLVARAVSVLNVALAIAVLAPAPRLVQVGLASLICGLTLRAALPQLLNGIRRPRRDSTVSPHRPVSGPRT